MTSGVGEVTRLPAADGIARRDPNLNKQHRVFRYSGLMPTSAFCQTPSLAARRDWHVEQASSYCIPRARQRDAVRERLDLRGPRAAARVATHDPLSASEEFSFRTAASMRAFVKPP
jgi:hypothetical protein